MKMKKKTIKTIGITAGVIAAVGAGVTAVCLAIKNKKKPAAEIPYLRPLGIQSNGVADFSRRCNVWWYNRHIYNVSASG